MVRQCQVCQKTSRNYPHLSFHSLPTNLETRGIWFALLGVRKIRDLPKRPEICSEHFKKTDFIYKSSGRKFLNKDALPMSVYELNPPRVNSSTNTSNSSQKDSSAQNLSKKASSATVTDVERYYFSNMSDNDEPEETVTKRCFLDCAITAPIISFTADTLASSIAILEQRKKHSLKYSDIELPKEIDDSIGYHSKCRNNFNALKAQFKVDLNKPSGSKVLPVTEVVDLVTVPENDSFTSGVPLLASDSHVLAYSNRMDAVPGPSNEKLRSWKSLSKEEKQMVYRVYQGLKCTLPTVEAMCRCSFLTGVYVATVQRIVREKKMTGTVEAPKVHCRGRKKIKLDEIENNMTVNLNNSEEEPSNFFIEDEKFDITEHHLDDIWENLQDNDQTNNDTIESVSVKKETDPTDELVAIKAENDFMDELVTIKQENDAVDQFISVKQEIELMDKLVPIKQENDVTSEFISVKHENGDTMTQVDHLTCTNFKRKANESVDVADIKSDFVSVKHFKQL